jgi:predicted nucleic acid-binding protein
MKLVDTSIWIDHLRQGSVELGEALQRGEVLTQPFVIGEIALGSLRQREVVLPKQAGSPPLLSRGQKKF